MGKHGMGDRNVNVNLFVEFCSNYNLVIGSTLFSHRGIHKITWISLDHRTRNQIDHITISGTWRRSLIDVRNCRGADTASDHHLITATLSLKLSTGNRKTCVARKKFNLERLKLNLIKISTKNISESQTPKNWDTVNPRPSRPQLRTFNKKNISVLIVYKIRVKCPCTG